MKLQKFKEKNRKSIGIIVFTIACILLVSGVILYRTFAIFEVRTNQNVIKGTVQDPGNLYFAFYQKNEESGEYEIQKEMPNLSDGYVLDEVQSYCGVNGEKDKNVQIYLSEDGYIKVKGMKTSRTKCNLYFAKGIFIKEKGIPVVESGDGLYKVEHPITETEGMDDGWRKEEYRFAGKNPNNYVWFNEELWRIIGLVNVKVTKEDGSKGIEQRLKIIRSDPIGGYPFNKDSNNDWTKSTLMQMLNGIYFNSSSGTCWKTDSNVTTFQDTCKFDGTDENNNKIKGLNDTSKSMIDENIIWSLGGSESGEFSVSTFYKNERGNTVWNDRPTEWKKEDIETFHSIGLMYPSDYGYATSGEGITRDQCFETQLHIWNTECIDNDWLKLIDTYIRFLTPSNITYDSVFSTRIDGKVDYYNATHSRAIYPVVYLLPNVTISSGTGTADDMFKLSIK